MKAIWIVTGLVAAACIGAGLALQIADQPAQAIEPPATTMPVVEVPSDATAIDVFLWDTRQLASLRATSALNYATDEQLMDTGYVVCDYLDQGYAMENVHSVVAGIINNPDPNDEFADVVLITTTALDSLCPWNIEAGS